MNQLTDAEQVVLNRIYMQWPVPNRLTHVLPLDTHRYFLAHADGAQWAVLRLKNQKGLEDWHQRGWRLFPSQPTITDVTLQVLELIEAILTMGPDEYRFADVWALFGPEIRFVATGWGVLPPGGAIPLWAYAGSRHDIPINQFRNSSHEYHAFIDHPLLRIAQ